MLDKKLWGKNLKKINLEKKIGEKILENFEKKILTKKISEK